MAHIRKLHIEGLAGTDKTVSLNLDRNINIFFGSNGCGKSTVLKIIHSAMSFDASTISDCPFEYAEVEVYSRDHNKYYTYCINKKDFKQDQNWNDIDMNFPQDSQFPRIIRQVPKIKRQDIFVPTYWKEKNSGAHPISGSWAHEYLSTSRDFGAIHPGAPINDGETPYDELFAGLIQQKWIELGIRIDRKIKEIQETGITEIIKSLISSPIKSSKKSIKTAPAEITYQRLANFLTRQTGHPFNLDPSLKETLGNDPALKQVAITIEGLEKQIESANRPKKELEDIISLLFIKNKKIEFDDNYGIKIKSLKNRPIALKTLASGEKHLLYILIYAIVADISSLIIDEPELSLHIAWQKELVKFIQILNPNSQLIFATHSPEILADVSDSNIISL